MKDTSPETCSWSSTQKSWVWTPEQLVRLGHYERAPKKVKPYLKDLCQPRQVSKEEECTSPGISADEEDCLKKVLEVLEGGNATLAEGLKTTIEAYGHLLKKR